MEKESGFSFYPRVLHSLCLVKTWVISLGHLTDLCWLFFASRSIIPTLVLLQGRSVHHWQLLENHVKCDHCEWQFTIEGPDESRRNWMANPSQLTVMRLRGNSQSQDQVRPMLTESASQPSWTSVSPCLKWLEYILLLRWAYILRFKMTW